MTIGPCDGCAATRFIYADTTASATLAQAEAQAAIINGYNMNTVAWGTFLQLHFAGGSGSTYTTSVESGFGGLVVGFVNPIPSFAFSIFGNGLCSGDIGSYAFVRGQQLVSLGDFWNIQTPPWCYIEDATAIPSLINNPPYGYPQIDGPGTLICTDESDTGPLCVVDVPIPAAWPDVATIAGGGPSGGICWNFIYSYLTLGSLCDDPP